MEFIINKNTLQKELGYFQGIVDRKSTIPALSNILIESVGENTLRITGTDLDITIRCEAEAEIKQPGTLCIQARKLFDVARLLPDAPVHFRNEGSDWTTLKCERSTFKIAGISKDNFPEIPTFHSTPVKFASDTLKTFIDHTIFAITLEESRYTLSGAKFMLGDTTARMVTTDGHRLAFIERTNVGQFDSAVDVLIPRKTLAELIKLLSGFEGDIGFGADENHVYFEIGQHLLTSRTLAGQFPNYDMVLPKNNDKSAQFDTNSLNQAMRRVALMADDRSRAVKLHLAQNNLQISAQTAEEGEANESISTEYTGDEIEVGFNVQYLQDFLNVIDKDDTVLEFKDANSQALLRPATSNEYTYKYVVMPMRL
ncbi:MAG: DNA polymerase III subunit beta [Pyrinomonadaceae bacterium MAG19_C2-C3]|nr:DNA polymerase III subunit beta [Pyrinomonadaceae bacterium MAG19_C2-C3]